MKKKRYTQVHHWPSYVYTQVHYIQAVYTYTCTFTEGKACIPWKTKFLVQSIWSMVLVQGIWSEVLTLGIWSKVLVLSGFGPWYWERPKSYIRRRRSLGQGVQVSNIWWSVRSSIQVMAFWSEPRIHLYRGWRLMDQGSWRLKYIIIMWFDLEHSRS